MHHRFFKHGGNTHLLLDPASGAASITASDGGEPYTEPAAKRHCGGPLVDFHSVSNFLKSEHDIAALQSMVGHHTMHIRSINKFVEALVLWRQENFGSSTDLNEILNGCSQKLIRQHRLFPDSPAPSDDESDADSCQSVNGCSIQKLLIRQHRLFPDSPAPSDDDSDADSCQTVINDMSTVDCAKQTQERSAQTSTWSDIHEAGGQQPPPGNLQAPAAVQPTLPQTLESRQTLNGSSQNGRPPHSDNGSDAASSADSVNALLKFSGGRWQYIRMGPNSAEFGSGWFRSASNSTVPNCRAARRMEA